jgi:hypothetical protein
MSENFSLELFYKNSIGYIGWTFWQSKNLLKISKKILGIFVGRTKTRHPKFPDIQKPDLFFYNSMVVPISDHSTEMLRDSSSIRLKMINQWLKYIARIKPLFCIHLIATKS